SVEFTVVGQPPPPRDKLPRAQYRVVTPGYFAALGVPLVAGRALSDADRAAGAPVVLVNQHMAKLWFAGRNPVGERIAIDDNDTRPRAVEIVGVVGDVKQTGLEDPATLDIYLPLAQVHPDYVGQMRNAFNLVVRTAGDPQSLAIPIKRAIQALDHDV